MNPAADTLEPAAGDRQATAAPIGRLDRFLRGRLLSTLDGLQHGSLAIEDADGVHRVGDRDPAPGDPVVVLRVSDPRAYRMIAASGSVGAGEAYMAGQWVADDLVGLVRLLVRNRHLLDAMEGGAAALFGALLRGWHALQRNTRAGSRRNIAAHYDLGNRLFELFLDPTLMYSSAVFEHPGQSLEAASTAKLERICEKLQLGPGDRVLEIGTGWGGFALHAARTRGCHVTTTTISREQYEMAKARVAEAGLQDRVELLFEDYRALHGRFDKLVSIEMVEAIGHQYLDTWFERVAGLLEPHGMALVQAITIEDHRYRQALRAVDFIKRYIFPGSFIPSVSAMVDAAARTDLRLFHLEDIGDSYALTLRHWRERFLARRDEVLALGYDQRFLRMWEFYLAYCEGGFIERSIGNVQMLFVRPECRRPQITPRL